MDGPILSPLTAVLFSASIVLVVLMKGAQGRTFPWAYGLRNDTVYLSWKRKIPWWEHTAGHTASTAGEQGEMNATQHFPFWTLAQGMVPPTFQVVITPPLHLSGNTVTNSPRAL